MSETIKCRKLILGRDISLECRFIMSQHDLCMTFDFGSTTVFSTAIWETYLLYHKDIWIAVGDYYMYFLLNFALSIESNAVIVLLNCHVLIFCLHLHFLSLNCHFFCLHFHMTKMLKYSIMYNCSK